MTRKKYGIKNTAGMFDLFKGIAMLIVILTHTLGLFPSFSFRHEPNRVMVDNALSVFEYFGDIVFKCLISTIMPAFFLISGYGMRKRPISKMVIQQVKTILVPYLLAALFSIILHFVFHYSFFRYLYGAAEETMKISFGQILGLTRTVSFDTVTFYACGPTWFLLALFWSWIIVNILLNTIKDSFVPYVTLCVACVGWGLSFLDIIPWALSQGMVGSLFVYMGYCIKKKKYYVNKMEGKGLAAAICITIIMVLLIAGGMTINMADNVYSLGPVMIVECGLFSAVLVYVFLYLNCFNGKMSNTIRIIGRHSLYFICIHSIEMIAFPWYLVAERFVNNCAAGIMFIFCVRLMIDSLLCAVMIKWKSR